MHLKIQIFYAGSNPAPQPGILAHKMRELVPLHAPGSPHRFSCGDISRLLSAHRATIFAAENEHRHFVGATIIGHDGPKKAHLISTALADGVDTKLVVPPLTLAVCNYFAQRRVALKLVTPRRGDIRQLELNL